MLVKVSHILYLSLTWQPCSCYMFSCFWNHSTNILHKSCTKYKIYWKMNCKTKSRGDCMLICNNKIYFQNCIILGWLWWPSGLWKQQRVVPCGYCVLGYQQLQCEHSSSVLPCVLPARLDWPDHCLQLTCNAVMHLCFPVFLQSVPLQDKPDITSSA